MRKTWGRLGIAITAIAVGLGANAQTQTVKQPKTLTVGVNLDSNYDRITEFLPMVRDSVLKAIPRDRKQVKTVALRGSAQDATEAARKQGCDYLLQIDVVEIRGAAVDFSTRQFSEEIGPTNGGNVKNWPGSESTITCYRLTTMTSMSRTLTTYAMRSIHLAGTIQHFRPR